MVLGLGLRVSLATMSREKGRRAGLEDGQQDRRALLCLSMRNVGRSRGALTHGISVGCLCGMDGWLIVCGWMDILGLDLTLQYWFS